MTAKYCQSAGLARNCDTCKHSPANQLNQPKGQPIKPTIPKDLKCPFWTHVEAR